jgi:aminopeptidase-like protein
VTGRAMARAGEGAAAEVGAELHELVARLFPICRSITGDGVRETLAILAERVPLEVHEVPTGMQVLDWTVPKEWNVRDAYVADADGRRVIDFRASNLHVLGYSVPVRTRLPLAQLREHLFTLPEQPALVPYRTSYYAETWGFCLSEELLRELPEAEYEVCIDSTLEAGSLTYGELYLPGATDDEVLVYTHTCHPSLANDNLSGVVVAASLAEELARRDRTLSYRFVFAPGTIGSITWLARNEERLPLIRHGLVLAGVGGAGPPTYKRSRRGDAPIDRAFAHLPGGRGGGAEIRDFSPWGYDERQFCSPGFDLPVGRLSRTPHGEYPEYHTSADDLSFVRAESLADSRRLCLDVFELLERDRVYRNLSPKGEPQLGRRGLYGSLGGDPDRSTELALLWVLNLSDGRHSLLQIAERSGLSFDAVARAADALVQHDLLAEA